MAASGGLENKMTLRDLKKAIEEVTEADLDLPVGIWDDSMDGYAEPVLDKWDSVQFAEFDPETRTKRSWQGPGFIIE